ncbi:unnamed protein product, partial [Staurois parvus]
MHILGANLLTSVSLKYERNPTHAQGDHANSRQGRTDNSWGPRAIGDHGAPVSLPNSKKAYEKGTRGISWGPLLTGSARISIWSVRPCIVL